MADNIDVHDELQTGIPRCGRPCIQCDVMKDTSICTYQNMGNSLKGLANKAQHNSFCTQWIIVYFKASS